MTPPTVTCGHCGGAGYVPLPEKLFHALSVIGPDCNTTPDIVDAVKSHYGETVFIPAMCNRLRALEQFGLVTKVKTSAPTGGCWHIWERVEKDTPDA
jgi:hypothetical protein